MGDVAENSFVPSTPTQRRRSGCRRFGRSGYTGRLITRRANSAARAIEQHQLAQPSSGFRPRINDGLLRITAVPICALQAIATMVPAQHKAIDAGCGPPLGRKVRDFLSVTCGGKRPDESEVENHSGVPHQAPIADGTSALLKKCRRCPATASVAPRLPFYAHPCPVSGRHV